MTLIRKELDTVWKTMFLRYRDTKAVKTEILVYAGIKTATTRTRYRTSPKENRTSFRSVTIHSSHSAQVSFYAAKAA